MTIRIWGARTVSAGLLAAALATPLAGVAAAAPNPVPGTGAAAPSAPAPGASPNARTARAVYDQWIANRAPRANATKAAAQFTKNPKWQWDGIQPLINAELAAIRTEQGTLPGTINRAATVPTVANALRAYQARLAEYATALNNDRNARGTGDRTWPTSNPASTRLSSASQAVHDAVGAVR
ncbi:hypothetical protein [Tsukamurella ocularis]|uniref:hypothetical protein n=1 Tax=Tsukamurella ocularis TaxID=1970234 RepID=UPI002168A9C5|nr:hypothetical protein [Tsukamurella ocularis]MCS3778526.1 hypothetical protein [Tsukamurella ocularis]MCS3789227.1 hypothetical protein [Tsukamurella ocularis]MCS3853077.1 hypothetical protein [Tsukamurella ocularis]